MYNIKELLGKKVKFYREKRKLTQEQLAEKIGLNSRAVSFIERGLNFVTANTLQNLCLALDVTPKQIFDFDEDLELERDLKAKLTKLIDQNEDKLFVVYKIVRGYLE